MVCFLFLWPYFQHAGVPVNYPHNNTEFQAPQMGSFRASLSLDPETSGLLSRIAIPEGSFISLALLPTTRFRMEANLMKLRWCLSTSTLLLTGWLRAADTYTIDPAHSMVGFSVSHLVINNVKGKFDEFSGTLVLENGTVQQAKGLILAKSINTGLAARDKDLRSETFFDVDKFPTITFQSKKTEKKGSETLVTGDFTMHGVTKEVVMPIKITGPIKDPWGKTRIGLRLTLKLNRKDYGLSYNKVLETGGLVVGDEIEIEINAEATTGK